MNFSKSCRHLVYFIQKSLSRLWRKNKSSMQNTFLRMREISYKGVIPSSQHKTCSEYWWHLFSPYPLYFASQGRDIIENELVVFPWKSCHQQRWGWKIEAFQSRFPGIRDAELPCLCASTHTFSSCCSVELGSCVIVN